MRKSDRFLAVARLGADLVPRALVQDELKGELSLTGDAGLTAEVTFPP